MGVPAFYRWLSEKYPKIVVDMLEIRPTLVDGVEVPVNLLEPNPNNLEFDNLFIDMNGLIHPCSHPEDREAPATEEEMYLNVMKYVDRLFAAIRPRRLLFLAIDGVAPRAKMNQQRSRRFRAVQDAMERQKMMDEVRQEMIDLGLDVPPKKEGAEWDSNVITPGTEFMYRLSTYLWFYILDRINRQPAWRNIKVILSDASEPGEGEHKIMEFIRSQRCQAGYDPNQRHVIHGLDADLIMLALATHEPHFTILREKVFFGKKDRDLPDKSDAQKLLEAQSGMNGNAISAIHPEDEWLYAKPLQALHIDILREYLAGEFKSLQYSLPFAFDFERVVDDFVFMCFFVGNDFLPHLPSLDIRDGAIDFLIHCYKEMLSSLGNYLTSPGGVVNMSQADVILSRVGEIEEEVFRRRKQSEDEEEQKREFYRQRNAAMKSGRGSSRQEIDATIAYGSSIALPVNQTIDPRKKRQIVPSSQLISSASASASTDSITFNTEANQLAAKKLRDSILGKRSVEDAEVLQQVPKIVKLEATESVAESKELVDEINDEDADLDVDDEEVELEPIIDAILPKKAMSSDEAAKIKVELKRRVKEKEGNMLDGYKNTVKDNIRLHELGWKDRYYQDKYKKEDIEQGGGLKHMCFSYVQGLCWVLKYYYVGCPSWNWFYPFHYAPFASDLVNIDQYTISFELAKPFRPIEQLLAVLPAESVNALPEECRWLMTDASSPIRDIYISDAPLDPNGKHMPWLWVLLLPFVNENRISAAFELCKEHLSLESRYKNAFGKSLLFLHKDHVVAMEFVTKVTYDIGIETDAEVLSSLKSLQMSSDSIADYPDSEVVDFDPMKGHGMCGSLTNPSPRKFVNVSSTVPALKKPPNTFDDIVSNNAICLTYNLPGNVSVSSSLLPGFVGRQTSLSEYDLLARRPPRLGKGSFNMINVAMDKQYKSQLSRNYSQSNESGMTSYNQSRDYRYSSNTHDSSRERNQQYSLPTQQIPFFAVPHPQQLASLPRQHQPYPDHQIHAYSSSSRYQIPPAPPPSVQPPQSRFSFNQSANSQPRHLAPVSSLDELRSQLSQVLHSRQTQQTNRSLDQTYQPRSAESGYGNKDRNPNYSGNTYRRY